MILYIQGFNHREAVLEPLSPSVNVKPHEFLVGLAEIDDALDQADKVHDRVPHAAGQHVTSSMISPVPVRTEMRL